MRFLLDTNVLSEPLRERPDPAVLEKLARHAGQIATASVVFHEMRFGANRLPPSRRRARVEAYLEEVVATALPILPYDRDAAEWHAAERARLEEAGLSLPYVDGQIASIAAVGGLILVTRNTRHLASLKGVQIVSWHR